MKACCCDNKLSFWKHKKTLTFCRSTDTRCSKMQITKQCNSESDYEGRRNTQSTQSPRHWNVHSTNDETCQAENRTMGRKVKDLHKPRTCTKKILTRFNKKTRHEVTTKTRTKTMVIECKHTPVFCRWLTIARATNDCVLNTTAAEMRTKHNQNKWNKQTNNTHNKHKRKTHRYGIAVRCEHLDQHFDVFGLHNNKRQNMCWVRRSDEGNNTQRKTAQTQIRRNYGTTNKVSKPRKRTPQLQQHR